jgi:lysophospholipase L1-like esterase
MNVRHGIQDHRPLPFSCPSGAGTTEVHPSTGPPASCTRNTSFFATGAIAAGTPDAGNLLSPRTSARPSRPGGAAFGRVLAAFLLLLAAVVSCGDSGERLPRLAPGKTILAFGDSLTAGNGAGPGQSYPEILQGLLGIRVVKSGVPGEISAEGLRRLPGVLAQTKPDLVILCHGGNDFLRRLDTRQTAQNLRSMISLIRQRGAAVVLLAVPAPGPFLKPPVLYREVAAEMRVSLEEQVLRDVLSDGTLKADLIHPNARGYGQVASAVAQLLRKHGAVP